jgi:hypothetical protein
MMPDFEATLPNGKKIRITAANEAEADQAVEEYMASNEYRSTLKEQPGAVDAIAKGLNTGAANFLGTVAGALPRLGLEAGRLAGADIPEDPEVLFGPTWMKRNYFDRLTGGLSGLTGGDPNARGTYDDLSDIHPDYQYLARGAQTTGETAPSMLIPGLGAAARGGAALAPQASGSTLTNIGRAMTTPHAQAPGRAALAEGSAALGAGHARGYAELFYPGDEGVGVGAELAGSILGPGFGTVGLAKMAAGKAADLPFIPGNAERAASKRLLGQFKANKENPEEALSGLRRNSPDGSLARPNSTPAETSGSRTLLQLEDEAARTDATFNERLKNRRQATVNELGANARIGTDAGDPSALTGPARQQVDEAMSSFDQRARNIDEVVSAAEEKARAAAAKFAPSARDNANVAARSIIESAYKQARAIEKKLWDALPKGDKVQPTKTLNGIKGAVERLGGQNLDPAIGTEISRMRSDMEVRKRLPTLGTLLSLRSRALDAAANARAGATPDMRAASAYSMLADGILRDISRIPGARDAREFSRAMHDRFSRSFAGDVLQTKRTGADKIPDTQTLNRAFSQDGVQTNLNTRDLERASQPIKGRGTDMSAQMRTQQEVILRDVIGSKTARDGALDPAALDRYAVGNRETLRRFPEVQQDLTAARDASGLAGDLRKNAPEIKRNIEGERSAFESSAPASILKRGERPDLAVQAALSGNNPVRDFSDLAAMAKRGGDSAVAGLRGATVDWMFKNAADPAGNVSFRTLDRMLDANVAPGKPTLSELMRTSFTTTQIARLREVIRRGVKLEENIATGKGMPRADLAPAEDLLLDLAARVGGANLGAMSAMGQFSGAPIVAAGAGSRMMQKIISKMPQERARQVLVRAFEDPDLMEILVMRARTLSEIKRRDAKFRTAVLAAGIMSLDELGED